MKASVNAAWIAGRSNARLSRENESKMKFDWKKATARVTRWKQAVERLSKKEKWKEEI